MTVEELKRQIMDLPNEAHIYFGCYSLEFYRIKKRGDNLYQIEFNQPVYDDENGNISIVNLPDQE